jgi:hypothetical protein
LTKLVTISFQILRSIELQTKQHIRITSGLLESRVRNQTLQSRVTDSAVTCQDRFLPNPYKRLQSTTMPHLIKHNACNLQLKQHQSNPYSDGWQGCVQVWCPVGHPAGSRCHPTPLSASIPAVGPDSPRACNQANTEHCHIQCVASLIKQAGIRRMS